MKKINSIKPPQLPLRFFRWFCDPDLKEDLEGDLIELFERRAIKNERKAHSLFFLDVLRMLRPGIIKNFEAHKNLNNYAMLRNYLISAWRNLMKYKGFSAINILSLSIGMAACMVIYLFINDELSFDAFHKRKDKIYRLCEVQSFPGTNTQNVALSMPGMGPTMAAEFPEIETFARYRSFGDQLIEAGDNKMIIENVAAADSSFLTIFDFPVISGDKDNLLDDHFDAIVTEETAKKLYGRINVVGETFIINGDRCIIRGVMGDVPENSHLQFNVLLSIRISTQNTPDFDNQFGSNYLNTYFVLNENADLAEMEKRYPEYLSSHIDRDDINDLYKLYLQPLSDVHLASTDVEHDYNNYRKFNGKYIDVFVLVGIFILVIASLNFMNLTTARASNRAKEVGVRKAIGAIKSQLFKQFIIESILLAVFALLFAVALVFLSLPLLNNLIDRQLETQILFTNLEIFGIILLATLGLGLLAGLYPSIYLSSFRPVIVLKGFKSYEKKSYLRSSLIVIQFSLALGMIVCTLVVLQQLMFMKNKDVGYATDHILLVDMNEEASEKYEEIKQALLKESNVLGVTASGQRLGNNFHQWGFKVRKDTGIVNVTPSNVYVDYDYLDVYGIKLLSGRSFSRDYEADDGNAYIINKAFADELGFEEAVGQRAAHGWYPDDSLGSIIGVTENFNFNSLHFKVNTLSMVVHTDWGFSEMSIKINGSNVAQSLIDVEKVYDQFVTDYPISYEFLDDHIQQLYKSDEQMGSVITIIAILSIFIGCMGLFGLASISIQRRIKEVGIRKVMGASITELMTILSRNFALMILISFIIATPLTFLFLSGWLENFAYRIDINPLIFLLGAFIALIIALATISYHVIKAANSNPVNSLKCE
ncbi:FtsX-like permease family protein [Ekhidna sp.]|uniref:ABC transporter permease n=2 Tax=Ekhidna sp. TaxID=2608089 RepID=UPI003299463A